MRNFCLESFIDAHLLNPGDDFADLPETFVIFITEKDVIGKGKLMHDFFCIDPDDMNYKKLADKVRYFKEDEKGRGTSGGRPFRADRSGNGDGGYV